MKDTGLGLKKSSFKNIKAFEESRGVRSRLQGLNINDDLAEIMIVHNNNAAVNQSVHIPTRESDSKKKIEIIKHKNQTKYPPN